MGRHLERIAPVLQLCLQAPQTYFIGYVVVIGVGLTQIGL
jgi:hypothetical protein